MRSNLFALLAVLFSVTGASIPATAPATPPAIYNLGTLGGNPQVAYDRNSYGRAVNDAGQVAGHSFTTVDIHAFRYDGTPGSGGVMRDLGTFGGTYSFGHAINDAGQVAGVSNARAFRYDGTPGAGGVMHDLGTLGGSDSNGSAINDAGQVAGLSRITGSAITLAFLYTGTPGSGGVMRDLGTLGGNYSDGRAVNDAGQVVGWSHITDGTAFHAFRYDGTPGSGGVMGDLGTLYGFDSAGLGINDAGQVVGWSGTDAEKHAFLYTGTPGAGGQMIDLDAWLDANNPAEGAKWTLVGAVGISNTGWITGTGFYDPDGPGGVASSTRAYLLDASSLVVPEPPSLVLLTLAAPALMLRCRRHMVCAPTAMSLYRTAHQIKGAIR